MRYDAYLYFLPRVAPDPLSFSAKEQIVLLGRTPIDLETKRELRRLQA